MVHFRTIVAAMLLGIVSACGQSEDTPTFRSYDLNVSHPSPYATFIAVSPGARGERLPGLRQLNSRDFNRYLRDLIGCTVDPERKTHVIGDTRVPAGYMVPIRCMY